MSMHAERLENEAREYLRRQLGRRSPEQVELAGEFDERPLESEGAVGVFRFDLPPGSGEALCQGVTPGAERHYVVVGETNPNFFPAYGLSADEAYSLHLGTRFLLEMGLERLAATDEPAKVREAARSFVRGCNPRARIGEEELVLLFGLEDQYFAVYRVEIEGEPYYCLGGDLPGGFYPAKEHPPQVFLRLQLGRAIREEARRGREE